MALSTITNSVILEEARTTLSKAFAPITKFAHNFNSEYAKSATFKVLSDGATLSKNPTSYSSTASTGAPVIVTMDEFNHSFGVTPADKRNGWRLADLIETNARKFANGIYKEILSHLPTASNTIGAASAFSKSKLKSLSSAVDGDGISCGLTSDYYVQVIPEESYNLDLSQNGIYGFDLGIDKIKASILPTGTVGYVAAKDAFAVATAIPAIDEALQESVHAEIIELPELAGMSILMCNWLDTATRTEQISFGLMLGAAILDSNGIVALKAS